MVTNFLYISNEFGINSTQLNKYSSQIEEISHNILSETLNKNTLLSGLWQINPSAEIVLLSISVRDGRHFLHTVPPSEQENDSASHPQITHRETCGSYPIRQAHFSSNTALIWDRGRIFLEIM